MSYYLALSLDMLRVAYSTATVSREDSCVRAASEMEIGRCTYIGRRWLFMLINVNVFDIMYEW